ncbi:MAG: hemolysin III family protein [Erysipelotrichaceae bacterium]|nr:hemolysin III family protein [Erysipelotrichaceae bacterium]MCI9312081.1 hemolysin III family protein [Erysipelotrichaceae bacterium]
MAKETRTMRNMFHLSFGEEVANAITHGVMAILCLFFLPYAAVYSYMLEDGWRSFGVSVFIICLFLMFLISTVYHSMAYDSEQKYIFRKLDHICILLAIAGSYTPIAISLIRGWEALVILLIEWLMVLAGILLKAIAKQSFPKLSMSIYMVMGWTAVFFLPKLLEVASPLFLGFIIGGGVMYTIGAFFYAKPQHRYFHMIWHLFINLASVFHIIAIVFIM